MSLTCECGDDWDWYFYPSEDFVTLATKRPRVCSSCRKRIDVGATVVACHCYRSPNHDVEERIYGDEVPLANKYLCEECGGLYYSLSDLGFCVNLGEDMHDLVKEYAEQYSRKG